MAIVSATWLRLARREKGPLAVSHSGERQPTMTVAVLPQDPHDHQLVANVHPPGWVNPPPAPRCVVTKPPSARLRTTLVR